MARAQAKTEKSIRELAESQKEHYRLTQVQFRRTDERIGELVSAIGEWIRRTNNGKK